MIKGIEKTIIHLRDDKGWDKIEEIEGDWNCGRTYFVPKRPRLCDAPSLLSENPEPPSQIDPRYYEFEMVKERFEPLDLNGKKVAKHLYFEMK